MLPLKLKFGYEYTNLLKSIGFSINKINEEYYIEIGLLIGTIRIGIMYLSDKESEDK